MRPLPPEKITSHQHSAMLVQYQWEPGDATRYYLLLARLGESVVQFSWLPPTRDGAGHTMLLPELRDVPHFSYLAEKMGLRSEYDAKILETFLDRHLAPFVALTDPTRNNL